MFNFFLVLGLIPGTNFYLTFDEIMFGVFAMGVAYYVYHHQQESKQKVDQFIEYSQLHGFSFPVTAVLEEPIVRKVVVPLAGTAALGLNRVVRLGRRAA